MKFLMILSIITSNLAYDINYGIIYELWCGMKRLQHNNPITTFFK